MAYRLSAPTVLLTLVLTAVSLVLMAGPAVAACHIAGFVESDVIVSPDDGAAELVVELQGRQPSCAGTVDVSTVDGTAVAGEDYEAVTTTLTFEEGDDRVETVSIPILAGTAPGSSFTVELSDPTGGITGASGAATVTIEGDAAQPDDTPDDVATEDDVPDDDATADGGTDDAAAGEEAAGAEQEADAGDGGSTGILIAVVVGLLVIVGAFAALRSRS